MAPQLPEKLTTQDLVFGRSVLLGWGRAGAAANDERLSSTGSSSTTTSNEESSSSAPNSNKISFSPPFNPAQEQQHAVEQQQQQEHTTIDSDTDTTMSAAAGKRETTKPSPVQQRKSSRTKNSTLIFVDGYAIKKDNNYVVNGTEYVYGGAVGQEQPPQRKAAPKSGPKQPPKPRVVTAQEAGRRDKKAEIEKAILDKAPLRNRFLKEHLPVLTPFIEPKIVKAIQQAPVGGASFPTVPMYMQPDSITGDMRSYQLSGLNWMAKMYSNNMSCILGDEMGLGVSTLHSRWCIVVRFVL